MSQEVLSPARVQEIHKQAARRRTFAVISHPDAGKSTLTEALAEEERLQALAGRTQDHAAAVRSFLAKQPPVFEGR